jgi:chaperonin GroEL
MMLTTECVIADKPDENDGGMPGGMPGGMGGGMPGMM